MNWKNRNFLWVCIALSILVACTDDKKQAKYIPRLDSLKKDSVIQVPAKPIVVINKKLDDLASYIAGLNADPVVADSQKLSITAWENFGAALDVSWKRYDSTHIKPMQQWREQEMKEINDSIKTLFYPFSGPDILNAYTFFPNAKQHIMVGLEPVGTLPEFTSAAPGITPQYFSSVKNSLHAILSFSFFRTKSMAVDLHNKELDGTIHLMLLFLKRSGNSIVDIKPVNIDSGGKLVVYTNFEEQKKDTLKNPGVEIDFVDADSIVKKVFYFSVNLANDQMGKNEGFVKFINDQAPYTTYLKSASYLMYKQYFSSIRDLILNNSQYVLEDDSGIPLKYFTESDLWDIRYYGTYKGTIPMFSAFYQNDLFKAYTDTVNNKVGNLSFGIGYKYKLGESNLLLAKKKK